jgi:hypothetical protein
MKVDLYNNATSNKRSCSVASVDKALRTGATDKSHGQDKTSCKSTHNGALIYGEISSRYTEFQLFMGFG